MPGKPKSRKWNDVQTAIATVAIVTTLGLWNLFAAPSKAVNATETNEPVQPPPTEPPLEEQSSSIAPSLMTPTAMPQVKIMFTPGATPVVQQQMQQLQQPLKKKKKNNNGNNSSSGTTSVTQTKTS
jgi:hypothetical protein